VLHLVTKQYLKAGFLGLFLKMAQPLMRINCAIICIIRHYATSGITYPVSSNEVDKHFTDYYSQESRMLYLTALLGILQTKAISILQIIYY
jgi:hypothetical protein